MAVFNYGDLRISTTAMPFGKGHTVRANGAVVGNIMTLKWGFKAPGCPIRASVAQAALDLVKVK